MLPTSSSIRESAGGVDEIVRSAMTLPTVATRPLEQGHPRQCRAAQRDRNPAQINTG